MVDSREAAERMTQVATDDVLWPHGLRLLDPLASEKLGLPLGRLVDLEEMANLSLIN